MQTQHGPTPDLSEHVEASWELVERIAADAHKRAAAEGQYANPARWAEIQLLSEIFGLLLKADQTTIKAVLQRYPKEETND